MNRQIENDSLIAQKLVEAKSNRSNCVVPIGVNFVGTGRGDAYKDTRTSFLIDSPSQLIVERYKTNVWVHHA